MAEIKSTMEMVLARAEKLCASVEASEDNSMVDEGRRLAASFLRDEGIDFQSVAEKHSAEERKKIVQGALETFLRNITLPRDGEQTYQGALLGITTLEKIIASDISANVQNIL